MHEPIQQSKPFVTDLRAVEFLSQAAALDHGQARRFDALVSGETGVAGRALPAPTNSGVVQIARIHDPCVAFAACGATHDPGVPPWLADHHWWWSRPKDYTSDTQRCAGSLPAVMD